MKLTFFPPGDSESLRRSHWREFIEARDAVLSVLGAPLTPSKLIESGGQLGPLLANPKRKRYSWHEEADPIVGKLG